MNKWTGKLIEWSLTSQSSSLLVNPPIVLLLEWMTIVEVEEDVAEVDVSTLALTITSRLDGSSPPSDVLAATDRREVTGTDDTPNIPALVRIRSAAICVSISSPPVAHKL